MNALERLRSRCRDDAGFTLIEMLVTLSVMSVVMVMVTGAVLLAGSTSARVDSTGIAQSQVTTAFMTLDRQVRWASAISQPGSVGSDNYVEFLTPDGSASRCYQLRFNRTVSQVQERSWPQGTTTFSAWQPLASGVTAASFQLPAAVGNATLARLTVSVTAAAGGAKGVVTATTALTFTALNSTSSSATSVCSEGRSTP